MHSNQNRRPEAPGSPLGTSVANTIALGPDWPMLENLCSTLGTAAGPVDRDQLRVLGAEFRALAETIRSARHSL